MDENVHKNTLYRWQRQEKPRVLSRSDRIKSKDDIADWIKKVEDATDKATDVAFGLMPSGKHKGKAVAHHISGHVRDNESALNEAQELLSQWMSEKVRYDYDDGFDDLEAWRRARKNKYDILDKVELKNDTHDISLERLTKLALDEDFEIDETAIYERVKRNAVGNRDPYENLYELEDSQAVQSVLKTMLSKEMVKDNFKKDLGLQDEPRSDPRTKMELRHKMVKENRDKREKEDQKRKSQAQLKKEARLQAQQLILKEQKEREMRARREEVELKKEMAKIRKEMHEDRKHREEELRREREEEEKLNKLARDELERQRTQQDREMILSQRLENERKFKQMMRMEAIKSKITSKNLQCLHRHFTAWYDLVLSRRLLLGKVKAMSDWKLMLKIYGAWRSYARGQKLEVEAERHERDIIDSQKKMLMAERHWTLSTLRLCFLSWQLFTKESLERKELEKEQEQTKNKMMSLLKAVAEGKINKEVKQNESQDKKKLQIGSSKETHRDDLTVVSLEDQDFSTPVIKLAWGDNESCQTFRSDTSNSAFSESVSTQGRAMPKEPWQITHQHLKLSKKISNLTVKDGEPKTHTDFEIRKRYGTQPWMNKHFVANNFEHRYKAQQETLKEQQNQLREQKRLIEELQFEQKNQNLKQRLTSGADAPPLPPLEVIEAPPLGTQIPRDNQSVEKQSHQNGLVARENCEDEVNDRKIKQSLGGETDRTNLTTSRSELTSVSQVSQRPSVSSQNTKYLQVLKNMDQRAAERAKIKAERDEKRRKQEEEKLAQIQKEQQEKQMEIEAEKRAKAAAYRQKKLLEKQKEEERKQQEALLGEMNKKAEEHYRRSLLKYKGLLPFKKIISMSKRNWLKAVKHRDKEAIRQVI
ncbi:hypothetical protein Btru_064596 [Bulinus truncatus]|nr:hypothetical protein Btru_064596 [Bulinus truncatus]